MADDNNAIQTVDQWLLDLMIPEAVDTSIFPLDFMDLVEEDKRLFPMDLQTSPIGFDPFVCFHCSLCTVGVARGGSWASHLSLKYHRALKILLGYLRDDCIANVDYDVPVDSAVLKSVENVKVSYCQEMFLLGQNELLCAVCGEIVETVSDHVESLSHNENFMAALFPSELFEIRRECYNSVHGVDLSRYHCQLKRVLAEQLPIPADETGFDIVAVNTEEGDLGFRVEKILSACRQWRKELSDKITCEPLTMPVVGLTSDVFRAPVGSRFSSKALCTLCQTTHDSSDDWVMHISSQAHLRKASLFELIVSSDDFKWDHSKAAMAENDIPKKLYGRNMALEIRNCDDNCYLLVCQLCWTYWSPDNVAGFQQHFASDRHVQCFMNIFRSSNDDVTMESLSTEKTTISVLKFTGDLSAIDRLLNVSCDPSGCSDCAAIPLQSWMDSTEPQSIISSTNMELLWCTCCRIVLIVDRLKAFSGMVWLKHVLTQRHKLMVMFRENLLFDENKFVSEPEKQKCTFQNQIDKLDNKEHSGLQFFVQRQKLKKTSGSSEDMIRKIVQKAEFDVVCEICAEQLNPSEFTAHITGVRHLFQYVHSAFPMEIFSLFGLLPDPNDPDFNPQLLQVINTFLSSRRSTEPIPDDQIPGIKYYDENLPGVESAVKPANNSDSVPVVEIDDEDDEDDVSDKSDEISQDDLKKQNLLAELQIKKQGIMARVQAAVGKVEVKLPDTGSVPGINASNSINFDDYFQTSKYDIIPKVRKRAVYVLMSKMPIDATEPEIRAFFAPRTCYEICLVHDSKTNKRLDIVFVEFIDYRTCAAAMMENTRKKFRRTFSVTLKVHTRQGDGRGDAELKDAGSTTEVVHDLFTVIEFAQEHHAAMKMRINVTTTVKPQIYQVSWQMLTPTYVVARNFEHTISVKESFPFMGTVIPPNKKQCKPGCLFTEMQFPKKVWYTITVNAMAVGDKTIVASGNIFFKKVPRISVGLVSPLELKRDGCYMHIRGFPEATSEIAITKQLMSIGVKSDWIERVQRLPASPKSQSDKANIQTAKDAFVEFKLEHYLLSALGMCDSMGWGARVTLDCFPNSPPSQMYKVNPDAFPIWELQKVLKNDFTGTSRLGSNANQGLTSDQCKASIEAMNAAIRCDKDGSSTNLFAGMKIYGSLKSKGNYVCVTGVPIHMPLETIKSTLTGLFMPRKVLEVHHMYYGSPPRFKGISVNLSDRAFVEFETRNAAVSALQTPDSMLGCMGVKLKIDGVETPPSTHAMGTATMILNPNREGMVDVSSILQPSSIAVSTASKRTSRFDSKQRSATSTLPQQQQPTPLFTPLPPLVPPMQPQTPMTSTAEMMQPPSFVNSFASRLLNQGSYYPASVHIVPSSAATTQLPTNVPPPVMSSHPHMPTMTSASSNMPISTQMPTVIQPMAIEQDQLLIPPTADGYLLINLKPEGSYLLMNSIRGNRNIIPELQQKIGQFFFPSQVINVHFLYNVETVPSSSAYVEFFDHNNARQAMLKNGQVFNGQPIHLVLHAPPQSGAMARNISNHTNKLLNTMKPTNPISEEMYQPPKKQRMLAGNNSQTSDKMAELVQLFRERSSSAANSLLQPQMSSMASQGHSTAPNVGSYQRLQSHPQLQQQRPVATSEVDQLFNMLGQSTSNQQSMSSVGDQEKAVSFLLNALSANREARSQPGTLVDMEMDLPPKIQNLDPRLRKHATPVMGTGNSQIDALLKQFSSTRSVNVQRPKQGEETLEELLEKASKLIGKN